MGRPVLLGQRALGVRTCSANELQAQGFGPLAGDQAHTAGGGMEQHMVTFLQAHHWQGTAQQVLGGQALEHHGGASLEADGVGELADVFGGHHTHFAVAAGGVAGIRGAVAGLQVGDAGADGLNDAGAFHAQGQRHGEGVQASALVNVNEVQADRVVADADLAGAGVAHGHVHEFELFRAAGLVDADGLGHGLCLLLKKNVAHPAIHRDGLLCAHRRSKRYSQPPR